MLPAALLPRFLPTPESFAPILPIAANAPLTSDGTAKIGITRMARPDINIKNVPKSSSLPLYGSCPTLFRMIDEANAPPPISNPHIG